MWFGVLISLVTQAAKVDQVNGTWVLVERWDGQLVDLHAECLGSQVNEGQMLVVSPEQFEACAPGSLGRDSQRPAPQDVHWANY